MAKEKQFTPIPASESLQDFLFPLYGVDVLNEFGQQRPGTTPVGRNVRAQEPRGLRLRGGARPGLSKYIPDTLPAASPLRSDTFNRADENPLGTPSDGGSAWTTIGATDGQLVSNQATSSSGTLTATSALNTGSKDGIGTLTIADFGGGNGGGSVFGRIIDLGNFYSFGVSALGSWSLAKKVANVTTFLAINTSLGVFVVGDTFSLGCVGSVISGYKNGQLLVSVIDTSFPTGTTWAMQLRPTVRFDNFRFDPPPSPVQHLNYIVDPTVAALLDNFDSQDEDATTDPSSGARNPGRLIRGRGRTRRVLPRLSSRTSLKVTMERPKKKPGRGSGRQPNRNKQGGGGATFVQANQADIATPNASGALAFTSDVTKGHLLLVFGRISHNGTSTPAVVTVTDTLNNNWTQAGSYLTINANFQGAAVFWALANASGPCTVTVAHDRNPASAGTHHIALAEYAGVRTIDSTATNVQVAPATALTTGTITVAGAGELVVAAFMSGQGLVADSYSGGSGTSRLSETSTRLALYDILSQSSSTALTVTASSAASNLFDHAAFGLSFKTVSRRTPREVTEDQIRALTRIVARLETVPLLSEDNAAYLAALKDTLGDLRKELESQ